ncbi:MAG: 50S ribosomal protein L25 [Planctomycetota bacterium]
MSDETTVLKGKVRERTGSRYSRRARAAGGLPAVVYGHKEEPVSVTLDAHQAILSFNKGERVFQLDLEGQKSETVLLRDLQFDHLGTNIVHADLARVDLNERVNVTVPLHLIGENDCKGLKHAGATLMHPAATLDIECAVTRLPEFIEVDIRELDAHDSIQAKDVKLPYDTMKLLTDPDAVVAHIVIASGADDDDAEAATVDGGASPEVITEKKSDD